MAENLENTIAGTADPADRKILTLAELRLLNLGEHDTGYIARYESDPTYYEADDEEEEMGFVRVLSKEEKEAERMSELSDAIALCDDHHEPYGPFDDATAIDLFNSGKYEELIKCNRYYAGSWAAAYFKGVCLRNPTLAAGSGCGCALTLYDFARIVHVSILSAAEHGDHEAQNAMGVMREHGFGISVDLKEAFAWYSKAAEDGLQKARCNLARCYRKGLGCAVQSAKAFELYCSLAEAGDAKSQYLAAQMAAEGEGVAKNPDYAAYLLKKAAESGLREAREIVDACGDDSSSSRLCVEYFVKALEAKYRDSWENSCSFSIAYRGGDAKKPGNDAWILKSAPKGSALPAAATREAVKIPDLQRANPSFAALLIRYVRDRFGGDAPFVYRSAGISRKTYSAIIGNELRPVSKRTAIAFAFALRLPGAEFGALLKSAGFALSAALLEDLIFKACLDAGIYNLRRISEILEAHGVKPFELQDEEENE